MRVLLTADAVGGVWTYALDLARALAPLDVEAVVAVMGPSPGPALREAGSGIQLIDTGLPLDWLTDDRSAARRAGEALAALAAEERVDLVHLNAPPLAVAPFPVPVLAVAHSSVATWWTAVKGAELLPADFAWRAAQFGEGLRVAARVAAPSAAYADAVARTYGLPARPTVVHNARALLSLTPTVAPASHAFTAGRLWDEGKGTATLDRAAALAAVPVLAAGPLLGPNGVRAEAPHLCCIGNLSEPELLARLAERPIFVSAALYEPFGLSVLEAAHFGCALVLSENSTFRELWDGAARFVPARDAEAYAAALDALVADRPERALLGAAARARAGRFTVERQARAYLTLYREMLIE